MTRTSRCAGRPRAALARPPELHGSVAAPRVLSRLARLRASAVRPLDVTVIGAGMAGLVAALEIERLGHRVRVIEASERVGGRVWTWRSGQGDRGAYGELGAMRIPAEHAFTLHYVREARLAEALRPFPTTLAAAGWLRYRDVTARWSEAEQRIFPLYDLARRSHRTLRPITLRFAGRLKTMLDVVAPRELRERFDAELTGELLDVFDGIELAPYLDPARPRVDLSRWLAAHPQLRRAWSRAIDHFLGDVALETQDALYTLAGGMDRLPAALAARLSSPPITRAPVVALESRPDGVVVHACERGRYEARRADWVVCTVPFSALRRIELIGFGAGKREVIASARYCPATKVLLRCRERFWERGARPIRGGASCLDGPSRQLYYPAPDPAHSDGAGVLLASYTIGADARALAALTPDERVDVVRREASALHPELAAPGMIEDAISIDWQAHPWTAGGCSVPWDLEAAPAANDGADLRAAARPEGRIFFAGEHCSAQPAWIEGAVTSALDAVESLLDAGRRA